MSTFYKFPELVDGNFRIIEEQYCELKKRYRDGLELQPEELDWMDTANSWLQSH